MRRIVRVALRAGRVGGALLIVSFFLATCASEADLQPFQKKGAAEPNVLILLDTSGSMNFYMKDEKEANYTYGDGSKPAIVNNKIEARHFGRDIDKGASKNNNDIRDEYNYHPLLRYIPTSYLTGLSEEQKKNYFAQWNSSMETGDAAPKSGESNYKYPNDSRMYALKNVMHRLLRDEEIYKGLKIGLATYYQSDSKNLKLSSNTASNYYRWNPVSGGTKQKTYWDMTSKETGRIREQIASTSDPVHLENLRRWFDGDGTYYDIKAFGGTPLCYSIYQSKTGHSTEEGSALQFFRAPGVITDECQDNYLIALTDGADSYVSSSSCPSYVDNLRKATMYVYGTNTKAKNIKTYMMGFTTDSSLVKTLNNMAAKGGTGKSAFIASDVKKLLEDFREIFEEIQSTKLGHDMLVSATRVIGGELGLYLVHYETRSARQWNGFLTKWVLTLQADGTFDVSESWEAANRLAAKPWQNRKLFSAFEGMTAGGSTNLYRINDFSVSGNPLFSETDTILGIPDSDDRKNFIRWISGMDVYGEEGGSEIRKLWDICNSGLVKVGPPSAPMWEPFYTNFANENKDRSTRIYAQSNSGMLHAFDDDTGDEVYSFIPPNVLYGGRLRGLRWADGSTVFSRDRESISRYLLDGPVTVEDVLIGGKYRTLLIGFSGLGGAGMYALDVTDADPDGVSFKWAIENDIYRYDATNKDIRVKAEDDRAVLCWKGKDNTTEAVKSHPHKPSGPDDINPAFDYRRLRRSIGVPLLGRDFADDGHGHSSWQWLLIMGSGSPVGVYGDYSSPGAVYIVNVDDGSIKKDFKVDSAVASPIVTLTEALYKELKVFFTGDISGKVYKGDLSKNSVNDWNMFSVLEFPSNTSGLSLSLGAIRLKDQQWVMAGTGDTAGYIDNGKNDRNYFAMANVSGVLPSGSALRVRDTGGDLHGLDPESGSSKFVMGDHPSKKGWFLKFTNRERMHKGPTYVSGLIQFSTFIPDEDVCSDKGVSRVYMVHALTGESAWNPITESPKKYNEYPGKIGGVIVVDNKVLIIDKDGKVIQLDPDAVEWPPEDQKKEALYWKSF